MKPVLLLLVAFLLIASTLPANNLSIVENTDDCLRLHFSLENYQMSSANASAPVKMQKETDNLILNNYNLPVFTYMLQIPEQHKAVVRIASPRYAREENFLLSKTDADIIVNDEYVLMSEPFVMRGNRLSTLAIQPFLYKAGSGAIEILQEADIEIDFVADETSILTRSVRQTKEYKSWLSKSVLNYRDNTRDGDANGSLLIIYNSSAVALTLIQPLIDWKHQKGWDVTAVSTQTAGNATSTLKSYIQNAYNTWENPPEYILILGRATATNAVPTYSEFYNHQAVGDYKYTLLDGPDLVPDAYIGRLTFSSTDQLTAMINKTIAYEKQVGLSDTDWYNKALLVSDPMESGISCNTTIEYIRDLMINYNPTVNYTYANSGAFPSIITGGIAQGVSNFYYRGHNGYSNLTNSDINGISNNGKYPFISFITCFSGNFGSQSTLCPGESFMRAGSGIVPKGAIGFVGASCETHTCLNNIMMGGMAYGMYDEGLTSQGQAMVRSKLALMACYPQNPANYHQQNFQSINLLGDPSVDIWLKQPLSIVVNYPAVVRKTNGVLRVIVTDTSGNPVHTAKVCLLKGNDEIFQVGYTNSSGVYTFNWSEVTTGTATLTVTKPNCNTYQGTVAFDTSVADFSLSNISVFSQLSSGANYTLPVNLTNNQYGNVTNVTASLSSASEYIIVTGANLSFGNMTMNQTVTSSQSAIFAISPECPQGATLDFTLQVHGSYNGNPVSFSIPFSTVETGPSLSVSSTQMGTDNILTPAETSQFTVTLKNLGVTTAVGISAHLSCYNPGITITPANVVFNSIAASQTGSNTTPFFVTAASSMYVGTPVEFTIQVQYNGNASHSIKFTLVIGNVVTSSMTGPDAYGYVCVANSDSHPWAKPYNWIELNPAQGGDGIQISLDDSDMEGSGTWQTVNLTTPFNYYGVSYNQLTICTNGFIMPGTIGSQEWMNWQIPGPMVPRPIIAPFWDDLIIQSTSRILYKNDTVNHRFIVEWMNLKNRYNISMNETFEVVIYYTSDTPSPTGDHPFLFQYKNISNVDAGNYGTDYVDHGQYATIGIADHTGYIGLQYTYQNLYPASGTALANNSTLYFNTIQNYSVAPIPIVQSFSFSEISPVYSNNQIDCGEVIAISPLVANIGFVNLPLSNLSLSSTDVYVTILNNSSTLAALAPQESAIVNTPFIFSIASNCPNQHQLEFDLAVNGDNRVFHISFTVGVTAPQIEYVNLNFNGNPARYIEPQTATSATLRISNITNLPVPNGVFTLTGSELWSVNPAQVNVNLPASGYVDINFSVQVLNTAPVGETINLRGHYTIPGSYDSLYINPIYVGTMADLAMMNCEDANLNPTWSLTNGISFSPATHLNNTGTEIVIAPTSASTHYWVYSPVIFARDSQLIQVKFDYLNQNSASLNTLYASINESTTWQSLISYNTPLNAPYSAVCYIDNLPDGIQSVRFKWQTTTDGLNNGLIVLDNIFIKAIHHPLGYISGTISSENSPLSVAQARIFTSEQPEIVTHPDEEGHYSLPLYRGSYTIHAQLEKHLSRVSTETTVQSSQTIEGVDFFLPYMQKPVNLTYQIEQNTLNLNWQLEELPNAETIRSTPDYFKIFIIHDGICITDTTSAHSYQNNLNPGSFQVYIKSVFLDDLTQEMYSDSSNVLSFTFTDTQDINLLPQVFALQQNHPNPFNPATCISYSLKTKDFTKLRIYNVKGQCVRNLVSGNQKQGNYQLVFDGLDDNRQPLSSGIYYYRLTSGSQTITRKMVMLK